MKYFGKDVLLDLQYNDAHTIGIMDRRMNEVVNGHGGFEDNYNSESRFWNNFAKYLVEVDALRKDMDCLVPNETSVPQNNSDGFQGCMPADATPSLMFEW